MKISQHEQNGITLITLEGRIDTENAVEMNEVFQNLTAANKYKLVVDMSGLTYISSAGLRILADTLTRSRQAGGDVKLAAVNKRISRVLQIIGFTHHFAIYETTSAAIKDFQAQDHGLR